MGRNKNRGGAWGNHMRWAAILHQAEGYAALLWLQRSDFQLQVCELRVVLHCGSHLADTSWCVAYFDSHASSLNLWWYPQIPPHYSRPLETQRSWKLAQRWWRLGGWLITRKPTNLDCTTVNYRIIDCQAILFFTIFCNSEEISPRCLASVATNEAQTHSTAGEI